MKKQTIAKLIVLGMVAAMLPISALAVDTIAAKDNSCQTECERPVNTDRPKGDKDKAPTTPTTPTETPAETPAVTVDTTTTADGKTAATVEVAAETSGTTSTATLTTEAVASLAEQAAGSDVVVLNVAASSSATEVVAAVPAAALADLASKTGADLTVASPVADITIGNADLAAIAGAGSDVAISAKMEGDTITFTVAVDGAAVEVDGGISVSIPVKEGAVLYLIAEDGTETVIEFTIVDGKAVFSIPANAKVRIG